MIKRGGCGRIKGRILYYIDGSKRRVLFVGYDWGVPQAMVPGYEQKKDREIIEIFF